MTCFSDLAHPEGTGDYAWGCCVQGYHFVYVYGATADYLALWDRDGVRQDHTLHKGWCVSLAEAQEQATRAAEELGPPYDGVGSVRSISLQERLQPGWYWPTSSSQRVFHRPSW